MKTTSLVSLFACIFVVSCSNWPTGKVPPDRELAQLAREKILAEVPGIDAPSVEMIRTNAPEITWQRVDWFQQYSVSWEVTSNRIVRLQGTWHQKKGLKFSKLSIIPKN